MTARTSTISKLPSFVLLQDDVTGVRRTFAAPSKVLSAHTAEELEVAFQEAEAARREGKWLAGYVSYEAGYVLEEKLKPLLPEGRSVPLMLMGIFEEADISSFRPTERANPVPHAPLKNAKPLWTREQYKVRYDRLRKHIAYGDCYQANLTFPIEAEWDGDPVALFHTLTERQPVRHGGIVNLSAPLILSRSPELFFAIDADGWIETRPMKGTAKRGKTQSEDDAIRDGLARDGKNQAENRMIVDLLRNDISRITTVGSLHVPELFKVETYPSLHQMISRIRAKLLPDLTLRDIFAVLFPCGSITGAPKIRAMEILHDLEEYPRDIYCGSIGWIAPDGQMSFNVAIRTVTLDEGGRAVFNVGGGIIFDSDADSEYDECLLKARFAAGQIDPSA
ncbi:MAG: aminodeoxychorismate synthase component I [Rhizobiaceae bacterium]